MSDAVRTLPVVEDAAYAEAVAEGLADADEGRIIPYEDVRRWLLSWGTDRELPPPRMSVVYRRAALRRLTEIRAYIGSQNPAAANRRFPAAVWQKAE